MRFFITTLMMLAAPLCQADWLDWRGPTTDGHSDATDLPLTWSDTENVAWKVPIHDFGHSTPVVMNGQIWITAANEDGTKLYAVCLDFNTGKVVHDITVFSPEKPQRRHPQNTYATPSVVLEKDRAYVHYGTFGTACIDTDSGKILWTRSDLHCDHLQGPVASPVLFEDLLIVHLEGVDVQYIEALDTKTGDTVWKEDRPHELYDDIEPYFFKKSYITPIITKVNGKPQMVSNGSQATIGYNPRTGEEIWRVVYGGDNSIGRPVQGNGMFFVDCGGIPGSHFLWAVREGGKGDVTDSHVAWKVDENVAGESSPVLVGDLLYMVAVKGTLTCLEAKTGKVVWEERLSGNYGASLLHANGRIYVSSKKGKTIVVEPGRTFKKLAENDLEGGFWASPAVEGNSLLLRTETHLYRIQDNQ